MRIRHKVHMFSKLKIDFALRKYKYTLFILGEYPISDLDFWEKYYVEFFHSDEQKYGYNRTEGGVGLRKHGCEAQVYDPNGKLVSEHASVKKCGIFYNIGVSSIYNSIRDQLPLPNGFFAVSEDIEHKTNQTSKHPVYSYKDGIFTKYDCIHSASKKTYTNAKSIYLCCIQKQRSAGGFFWCYEGDVDSDWFQKHIISTPVKSNGAKAGNYVKNRPICLIHENRIFIYDNMMWVERNLGYSHKGVGRVCRNERKRYKGLMWQYAD